jgi:hypothetical protein
MSTIESYNEYCKVLISKPVDDSYAPTADELSQIVNHCNLAREHRKETGTKITWSTKDLKMVSGPCYYTVYMFHSEWMPAWNDFREWHEQLDSHYTEHEARLSLESWMLTHPTSHIFYDKFHGQLYDN